MSNDTFKVARSKRFATPEGRISYPSLFEPNSFQGGEPRYQCSLLLKKGDPAVEEAIEALEALQSDATEELYGAKPPRNFEVWGITDGDEVGDDTAAGHYILKAANKMRPKIVDADKAEVMDQSEVYGGVYGRLNVVGKSYGSKTKGGTTFELLAVQVTRDGDPFGGGAKAINDAVDEF